MISLSITPYRNTRIDFNSNNIKYVSRILQRNFEILSLSLLYLGSFYSSQKKKYPSTRVRTPHQSTLFRHKKVLLDRIKLASYTPLKIKPTAPKHLPFRLLKLYSKLALTPLWFCVIALIVLQIFRWRHKIFVSARVKYSTVFIIYILSVEYLFRAFIKFTPFEVKFYAWQILNLMIGISIIYTYLGVLFHLTLFPTLYNELKRSVFSFLKIRNPKKI